MPGHHAPLRDAGWVLWLPPLAITLTALATLAGALPTP